MPSQPCSPSLRHERRGASGVSTICAMFSRVTSKTSGSSCSSRNASTSSAKACCSAENSKSTRAPGRGRRRNLTGRQILGEPTRSAHLPNWRLNRCTPVPVLRVGSCAGQTVGESIAEWRSCLCTAYRFGDGNGRAVGDRRVGDGERAGRGRVAGAGRCRRLPRVEPVRAHVPDDVGARVRRS